MSVIDDILEANHGSRPVAAAVLAHGLMVGDRETLKLGYSRESAINAATEQYGPFTPGNLVVINDLIDRRLETDPVSYGPGTPSAPFVSPDGSEARSTPYPSEGPDSLYPALPPRDDVPQGSERGDPDEFGNATDAGSIENGWVVVETDQHADGKPTLIGPFRSLAEAHAEAEEMTHDGIDPAKISVEPIFRPFAAVGVTLRATEAEEARYTAIMAMDPDDRTAEQERFIDRVADMLFMETTNEGTDGYDE